MPEVSVSMFACSGLLPQIGCSTNPGRMSMGKFKVCAPRFRVVELDSLVNLGRLSRRGRRENVEALKKRYTRLSGSMGNCRKRVSAGKIVAYAVDDGEGIAEMRKSVGNDTLEMLGWSSLCSAVSGFASTAMGKDLCRVLTPPSTEEESQALLDETSAGLEIDGLLGGILDFGVLQTLVVKGCLDRLSKGIVVLGPELGATATLLQVASTLQRGVSTLLENQQNSRLDGLQPISNLVEPMVVHLELCKLIWSKIDEDGQVKDSASPQLRQARSEVHTLEQRLQQLLNKISRDLSETEDAAENVIEVDGRICLIVGSDAGKADAIPGLQFQRGVISYLEPSQAVSLNNKLAEARANVQKAELAVLSDISAKLLPHLHDIYFVFESIVRLDVVAAKGKYSSSTGGRKPFFTKKRIDIIKRIPENGRQRVENLDDDRYSNQERRLLINLRKFRHPLLIDRHFWALRKSKSKLKEAKKSLGRMRSRVNSTKASLESLEASVQELEMEVTKVEENAPVPIDVHIGLNTRVVTITGPNTGGKTAAMKAVGLAALMAKVGLYVPAMEPVQIPWFDAVLADIGDEQSLSQSLSTFSGHLLRIKRILSEVTEDSLVLLDELGAGTDPTEGAALGMALLEFFADGGSLLTLATTHHGELKTLKYSDSRFENVSVEFDEERLAPTYKLLWGIPGRSNALNIARRLGLPNSILVSAQSIYGEASVELNEMIFKLEGAKIDVDRSVKESESLAAEIKEQYGQLLEAAEYVYEHQTVLQSEKRERLSALASAARSRLSAIARTQGVSSSQPVTVKKEVITKVLPANKLSTRKKGKISDLSKLTIGDVVYVPKLGRDAKVVGVNNGRKEITVQCGLLPITLSLKEVQ